jgi:hypothetical protein
VSTTAKLFIDPAPELGEQAFRYTIDCKYSTTRLWFSPGGLDLTERHRVSIVLQRHEDECQRCNLTRLWERHGDPAMKQAVDELYDQVQQRMVAKHLAGRRN